MLTILNRPSRANRVQRMIHGSRLEPAPRRALDPPSEAEGRQQILAERPRSSQNRGERLLWDANLTRIRADL
jgi:hypothetical protein